MKNKLFLLLIMFWAISCSNTESQNTIEQTDTDNTLFEGKWIYRDITKNDTSFGPFQVSDTMYLSFKTNRFLYDIEKLQKHSKGSFEIVTDSLDKRSFAFHYDSSVNAPSHTRFFAIEMGNKDSLIISEGPLKFYYSR